DTNAGSGGLVGVAAEVAETTNNSMTTASVGASSNVNLTGTFVVDAAHTAAFNEEITSFAGGLFAGTGGSSSNEVTAHTTASVGASAFVSAAAIRITATDHAVKPPLSAQNVSGTTGGLASAAGTDDSTTISFYTLVNIGNNATIMAPGLATDNPVFTLSALNTFDVYDSIAFTTGGVVSGAAAFGSIQANGVGQGADQAYVTIGTGANLVSSGMMSLSADGTGSIDQEIATDTYGAGTATLGQPTVDLRPDNEVTVGGTLIADGDLNLLAGSDANYNPDFYTLTARFDGFAGSAIPLSDVHAVDYLFEYDTITVDLGAMVETARNANLLTPSPGPNTDVMTAQAKAESWVSDLQEALLGSGALLAYQNATAPGFSYGVVIDNGIVETGITRHQTLILGNPDLNNPGGWDQSTGIVTQFQDNGQSTQAGGITFTTKPESISNDIVDQIGLDQSILSQYGASNPTLANYYNGAIGQLEAELAADNLVDPTTGQPINDYVMTVLIEPIFADAGSIFTQGTQLEGSGQWVAPSDASVTITNYTPAYLDIFGITIPLSNGGLFYNGLPEGSSVGNSDIGAHNSANLLYLQQILPAAGNPVGTPSAVAPNFSALPNPSATPPLVVVDNVLDVDLYNVNNSTQYPWPDISIMSTADVSPQGNAGQGISNIGGTVVLATATTAATQSTLTSLGISPLPPNDALGNIPISGEVQAANLIISTKGTLLINLPGQ